MTSAQLKLIAGIAVVLAAAAMTIAPPPLEVRQVEHRADRARAAQPAPAPAVLAKRIQQLGAGFDGQVGIAVRPVDEGWQTSWHDQELYPQQSVSKLWVAITALDAVDKRRVRLDDPVTVTRADLTLFHQPIAAEVLEKGAVVTTLGRLLNDAITMSDNTGNDRLMRAVGGPNAVPSMIAAKGLSGKGVGAVRFDNCERLFQSKVAGVTWDESMSVDGGFEHARDAVPMARRQALIDHYIADPDDGAAPAAISEALTRLNRGGCCHPSPPPSC